MMPTGKQEYTAEGGATANGAYACSPISASSDNTCSSIRPSGAADHDEETAAVMASSDTDYHDAERDEPRRSIIVTEQHTRLPSFADKDSTLQRLTRLIPRRSLVLLDLSQRGLTALDAHVIQNALLHNPTLSVLKLGYNNLRDSGCRIIAKAIHSHPSLNVFGIGFNSVGDEGCEAIAASLAGNSVLKTLYLSGNVVGERGSLALARALEYGCGLTCMHLTANNVGTNGVLGLMKAVAFNQNRRQEIISAQGQACNSNIAEDTVHHNGHGMINSSKAMMDAEEASIATGNSDSTNEIRNCVSSGNKLCAIQELFLGGTAMGSEGCLSVSNMILTNFSLRVLSLSDNGLTDSDVALLSQSLSRNKHVPLEVIQLSFNQLTCVGVEALMNAIWGSETLREIQLDNNRIRDRGAQLAAVVLTSVQLQNLDLGFNRVTTIGIKALMKSLAENASLQSLTLSGNPLDTNSAKAVSYALAFNKSLKEFFIDHCSVGYAAQRHIAAGIVSNSNIVLRVLTGFQLGATAVTLGFPKAIEQWSNDQVLKFIHLMWESRRSCKSSTMEKNETKENNPSIPDHKPPQVDAATACATMQENKGLCDPATVVAVAKSAFDSLGDMTGRVLLRLDANKQEQCPLVSNDAWVLEKAPCGMNRIPSLNNFTFSDLEGQLNSTDDSTVSSTSVDELENTSSQTSHTMSSEIRHRPSVSMKHKEWLSRHYQDLRDVAKHTFSDRDVMVLDQYFFAPVHGVEPCGSNICDSGDSSLEAACGADPTGLSICMSGSCPQSPVPSEPLSAESDVSSQHTDYVRISGQSTSPRGPLAFKKSPMNGLQRKFSYRYLSEALLSSASYGESPGTNEAHTVNSAGGRRRNVALMNNEEITTILPATKRARSSKKARIDEFPRIKKKLEILKSQSRKQECLVLMKQLKVAEGIIFHGRDIYGCGDGGEAGAKTRNGDDFAASDAETILLDLL